jgi:hypothetical protein
MSGMESNIPLYRGDNTGLKPGLVITNKGVFRIAYDPIRTPDHLDEELSPNFVSRHIKSISTISAAAICLSMFGAYAISATDPSTTDPNEMTSTAIANDQSFVMVTPTKDSDFQGIGEFEDEGMQYELSIPDAHNRMLASSVANLTSTEIDDPIVVSGDDISFDEKNDPSPKPEVVYSKNERKKSLDVTCKDLGIADPIEKFQQQDNNWIINFC